MSYTLIVVQNDSSLLQPSAESVLKLPSDLQSARAWHTPAILAFWKWREEALEFKASLGYMVRSCFKK